MNTNVLILEDEEIINDYIMSIVKKDNNPIQAFNVNQAIDIISNQDIDLILSDIIMEGQTGFDLLLYLKEEKIDIPIIMITALEDESSLEKAYDLGAIDYIVKPINKVILTNKIKNLTKYIYGESVDFEVSKKENKVIVSGKDIELTKIEWELFILLYSQPNRVYTKENIIEYIWSGNHGMSKRIVDINIFNIRKKLKHHSDVIKTKRGLGYYYDDKK